ncbi:RDD family protein [bacterium]|nr:RDD family protein [bacterium]
MKTCSVCDREITPSMVRHGGALTKGGEMLHRECHRAFEQNRPGARPSPSRRSFPDSPDLGPVTPVTFEVEYASFGRRMGAHLIDSFLLGIVTAAIGFSIGLGAALRGAEPTGMTLASVLASAASILLPILYCVVYWTRKGATPGKTAMGIRVVNSDDQAPGGVQSLVRYFAYILSSLPFCLGYAWMIWDRENRCWHDIIAGTRVIRA